LEQPYKKIDILSFSMIQRDARVLRQMEYLSRQFEVTAVGYGCLDPEYPTGARLMSVNAPTGMGLGRKLRTLVYQPLGRIFPRQAYEAWFWSKKDHQEALKTLLASRGQAIHANDWDALPVAVRAAESSGAKIVLDLHEYSPLQYENRWVRRNLFNPMIDYFLRTYAGRAALTITVNEMIAEKYAQVYGFRPVTIMNAPKLESEVELTPTQEDHIRLIHHGVAAPDRRLDLMVKALALTGPRFSLHFMLVETIPGYLARLRSLAQEIAPGRVFFLPPVKPWEIVRRISEFDIGFFLLPYTSFSYQAALPNKFFDFIAAGLAVCTGPSPEMARLSEQYGFGLASRSFDPAETARLLDGLKASQIDEMKKKALGARLKLNAEVEMEKLVQLYTQLLDPSSPGPKGSYQDG
jgi:hypothetical protein